MKYMKISFIFVALVIAGHAFGFANPTIAIESLSKPEARKLAAVLHDQPTSKLKNNSEVEYKESTHSHEIKKNESSPYTKFRQCAGTKRGKNRVLFTQDFQAPVRTVLLSSNLDTLIQADPLVFTTIQEFTSLPQLFKITHNENLYTIALRV